MRGRAGFTLVEVLVASTILVIIASMVFEAFSATLSAGKGLEERAELYHTARFIIRKLTEDLSSASLYTNNTLGSFAGTDKKEGGENSDELVFTGFGGRTIFTGTASDQARVTWKTEAPAGSKRLTLRRGENHFITGFDEAREMAEDMEVTSSLKSFDLKYFDNGTWLEAYDAATIRRLPKAVALSFTLEDGDGRTLTKKAVIPVGAGL
jgi:prepilin-type N-terminal cleavage/methylation domain-containing protein